MSEDTEVFSNSAVALDSGDLMQTTNTKVDQSREVKLIHTMRRTAAGIYIGHEETTVTMDAVLPASGAERDFYQMLRTGKIKTLRVKIPGETFAVVGAVSKRMLELPSDAPDKYTIELKGKTVV
jgi:hypothetical protein